MPNLLSLIKQAAVEAVTEDAPCAVFFGKVESLMPLRVKVEERFVLEENQLVMTGAAASFAGPGSRVVLLRAQGGGLYVIADVVM